MAEEKEEKDVYNEAEIRLLRILHVVSVKLDDPDVSTEQILAYTGLVDSASQGLASMMVAKARFVESMRNGNATQSPIRFGDQ
jgi:hypothetical protein